jgi:hypothetical protein
MYSVLGEPCAWVRVLDSFLDWMRSSRAWSMMALMLLMPAAKKGLGRSSNSRSELLKSSPSWSMLTCEADQLFNQWRRFELYLKGSVDKVMLDGAKR